MCDDGSLEDDVFVLFLGYLNHPRFMSSYLGGSMICNDH